MSNINSMSKLVGLNLKKLRQGAGFTAFQFAKMAGIKSEQQLYRYERGVNKIGIDELVAALKVLNFNIGEFFEQLEKQSSITDEQVNVNVDVDKDRYYFETEAIVQPFVSEALTGYSSQT